MFIAIPLGGLHILLGFVLCIISLRNKQWGVTLYFVFATFLMVNMWQLYAELKPIYRPLYRVLVTRAKLKGRELVVYKDYKILAVRQLFRGLKDPALAELCDAIDYPLNYDKVAVALQSNPDLSKSCALLHGRESLPLLALLQESYEPWVREEPEQRKQQLIQLNKVLKGLLESGADPNVRGEKGNSPVHWAAWYKNSQLVSTLLEHNFCVYLENDEKRTALKSGRNFEVKKILKKAAEDPAVVENCPHLIEQEKSLTPEEKTEYEEYNRVKQLLYGITNGRIDIVTHNVARGVDVNGRDAKGRSPLHLASTCKKAMPAIIEILIRAGADINNRDRRGKTPLMASVENHCSEVMAILLDKGADVSLADRAGATALHLMARWRAEKIIPGIDLLLAAGIPVDVEDSMGRTPAMMTEFASITGDAVLKVFLDRGADPNHQDKRGDTLLHKLAVDSSKKQRTQGVAALIEAGAELEFRNAERKTPLMLAVKRKKFEIVKMLLAGGALPNAKTSRGTPLLHSVISCREDSIGLLGMLLEAGADVNVADASGRTAMHRAFLNHLHLKCLDPIDRLLQQGADLDLVDDNGDAPLHNMAYWEFKSPVAAIRLVKQYGGDLDIRDNQGMTTLLRAARYGVNAGVTRALLTAGADPTAVDNRGNTLLHCVAMNQKGESLKHLAEVLPAANSLKTVNSSSWTPLELALKYGNDELATKLEEYLRSE